MEKSVERIIKVLNHLVNANSPCTLTSVAKDLGFSKSRTHRILNALKDEGWVEQVPETRLYTLGTCALQFSVSLLSQLNLKSVSSPYLRELSETVRETTLLCLRTGTERMYVDQVVSGQELRHIVELGKRLPLWLGAPGKVILAYMEEDEIELVIRQFIETGNNYLASGKYRDKNMLLEELVNIRAQGFATSEAERLLSIVGVAAPIFDKDNSVIGTISIAGPTPRFNIDLANKAGALVVSYAKKISSHLGHSESMTQVLNAGSALKQS